MEMTNLRARGKLDDVDRAVNCRVQHITVGATSPTWLRRNRASQKEKMTALQLVLRHVVASYHGAHCGELDVSSALAIHSHHTHHYKKQCYNCLLSSQHLQHLLQAAILLLKMICTSLQRKYLWKWDSHGHYIRGSQCSASRIRRNSSRQ